MADVLNRKGGVWSRESVFVPGYIRYCRGGFETRPPCAIVEMSKSPENKEGMAQPVWTFRFPLPLTLLLKRLCPCAPGSSGLSGTTGDFASETCFAALRVTA